MVHTDAVFAALRDRYLIELQGHGEVSVTDVAKALGVTWGRADAMLRKEVEAGRMIERRARTPDGRVMRVFKVVEKEGAP